MSPKLTCHFSNKGAKDIIFCAQHYKDLVGCGVSDDLFVRHAIDEKRNVWKHATGKTWVDGNACDIEIEGRTWSFELFFLAIVFCRKGCRRVDGAQGVQWLSAPCGFQDQEGWPLHFFS